MSTASVPSLERAATARFVLSPAADYLFILAPFWLGAFYLLLVHAFPSERPLIFFVFLAFLGETHFGATGLFLLARDNRAWLWQRRTLLLYVPLGLLIAFIAIGIRDIGLAILIGSVASGIHVTRQSIGISRLYSGPRGGINELAIYGASFGFLGVGFARFYLSHLPVPEALTMAITQITPIASVILVLGAAVPLAAIGARSGYDRRWLAVLVGCAIYSPYCFVAAPQDAIAVGVAMHWCQYLALNGAVYSRSAASTGATRKFALALIAVLAYGVVMASIHVRSERSGAAASLLVLIPLCGEMIHYYIDAFIWRFSDPQIRKNIGVYVWS